MCYSEIQRQFTYLAEEKWLEDGFTTDFCCDHSPYVLDSVFFHPACPESACKSLIRQSSPSFEEMYLRMKEFWEMEIHVMMASIFLVMKEANPKWMLPEVWLDPYKKKTRPLILSNHRHERWSLWANAGGHIQWFSIPLPMVPFVFKPNSSKMPSLHITV